MAERSLGPQDASPPTGAAHYWALPAQELLSQLGTGAQGLATPEAARRWRRFGPNDLDVVRPPSRLRLFGEQWRSPLILLLVVAAFVSALSGAWTDAVIVLTIVFASAALGFSREYRAQRAIAELRERVTLTASTLRDGVAIAVPVSEVVPGDVILLSAGSLVPADGRLLEEADLFVSQAVLTGESFPVEKKAGELDAATPLAGRDNCVFRGTQIRTGRATFVVVTTGKKTHFGQISGRLKLRPPETDFDRGLRHFGYVLLTTMLAMVLVVFAANVFLQRPAVETLLFSIALAVGLSPELLPVILSVNLAEGAKAMAARGVLVRRLSAIENLGSMDVLCTDKTGTLTEGVVSLQGAFDGDGRPSESVLELAARNAALQSGLVNPLDEAIVRRQKVDLGQVAKLGEIPFDFTRKRLSIVMGAGKDGLLVTKGAFPHILQACDRTWDGRLLGASERVALGRRFEAWSREGVRVIAVASRSIEARSSYGREDERDLMFRGFLTFIDRPKEGAREAIADLGRLGVAVKIITGDGRLVTEHLARAVGLQTTGVLTGQQLDEMRDEALWRQAERTDLFVEVDPNQKERIILALKRMGHAVGFMGDGINDAPAMHAADTSISVDQAADVAKEAADFVLLERHLDVLRQGIEEGRRTFANTLKYILTTTSANLGNMVSMAVASFFLPFLPLLAGQILLNNFLSDIPAIGLARDTVDPELLERPRRLNMRFIGQFMVTFGLLSSLFDFITFGALLKGVGVSPELFRTGWFIESLLSELAIALVVRTRRPMYRSAPGKFLLYSTIAMAFVAVAIPFTPLAARLGFVPPTGTVLALVMGITLLYVAVTERAKRLFLHRGW